MNEHDFVRLSDLEHVSSDETHGEGVYDPTGDTAYGSNGERIGTIRDALVEYDTGIIRYFVIDANARQVLVPVGHARIEDQGVYFDQLTNAQVGQMRAYNFEEGYSSEAQAADERVLRGLDMTGASGERVLQATQTELQDEGRTQYREQGLRTPDKLQLLQERLVVNKDRFVAGNVAISKHVETRQEQVQVPLQREEVVIERHAVTEGRPVEGAVLGEGSQTLQIDLEAERANVSKQAYVTEEIGIGKRTVTDTQTVTETVGREVLDVNKTGEVRLEGDQTSLTDSKTNS